MTQFAELSSEARNIVFNFFSAMRKKNIFAKANFQLMASLYQKRSNVNVDVLKTLENYIEPLELYMSAEEIACLQSEYAAVIRGCIKSRDFNVSSVIDSEDARLHIPSSLVELSVAIANPEVGSSVFLPFVGDGSFITSCENFSVDGFETDNIGWAISQIVANSVNPNANILHSHNECNSNKKYNYIFSFPPMLTGQDNRKLVDYIKDLLKNNLADKGEFYAVLPLSFCYNTAWSDVREALLNSSKEYSIIIIELPPMLQPVTSVSLCLALFVKDNKGNVLLADASGIEFFAQHDVAGSKELYLKVKSVIETIEKRDEKYVWSCQTSDITKGIDLIPSRHLIYQNLSPAIAGERLVKLSDLISIVPLTKEESRVIPLVGIRELSSEYLNCDIKRADVPMSNKKESEMITKNCFLASFVGGKFKVGRLTGITKLNSVALKADIVPFKIKSSIVTEDFLLRSIISEESEKQAKALSSGVIYRLSKEDFLSIWVRVPSLDRQKELFKEDTRSSLTEVDRKIIESHEEFRRDMHMKKHAIGQTLLNFNNWWKVLQKARKEGNGVVCDNAIVGKTQPITLADVYDNIQQAITKLQLQINKFDRGNGMEIKNFAITEFIEDYIAQNQSPVFKYIYDITPHHMEHDVPDFDFDEETGRIIDYGELAFCAGDPWEFVDFAPDALKIIFDNIVSNAVSHGFEDRIDCSNIIKVELNSEGSNFVVMISNNGKPLDNQISIQDVFTYNRSSKNGKNHYGIGGYEVQKLMREFGGDAILLSNPESEFPVTYKLIFYKTNLL